MINQPQKSSAKKIVNIIILLMLLLSAFFNLCLISSMQNGPTNELCGTYHKISNNESNTDCSMVFNKSDNTFLVYQEDILFDHGTYACIDLMNDIYIISGEKMYYSQICCHEDLLYASTAKGSIEIYQQVSRTMYTPSDVESYIS